jgi:uncharacterized protein YegJ (DUF2314 family)
MKNNVGIICSDYVDERKAAVQKNIEGKLANATHVKLAFVENEYTEHMWVLILKIDFENKKIVGTLDNDPYHIESIMCGDKVECDFSDVEQIVP